MARHQLGRALAASPLKTGPIRRCVSRLGRPPDLDERPAEQAMLVRAIEDRVFSESRKQKAGSNDTDRLKKYIARFVLGFVEIRRRW